MPKDIFKFNIFDQTRKKREQDAGLEPASDKKDETGAQPAGGMSQADFSYGPTGITKKPKVPK